MRRRPRAIRAPPNAPAGDVGSPSRRHFVGTRRSGFAQCTRGTIRVSKLKPVAGSRPTALPDRSPYRPSCTIVSEPLMPGATVDVLSTVIAFGGNVNGEEPERAPLGLQKNTVPLIA